MGRWLWWVVLCTGCSAGSAQLSHARVAVNLRAPVKTAPLAERLEAWEALRPAAQPEVSARGDLPLRNGSIVTSPDALWGVLEPRTPAANLVGSWRRSTSNLVFTAALGGIFTVLSGGLWVSAGGAREAQYFVIPAALAATGIGLVHLVVAGILIAVSAHERELVFENYEASLRQRLALPDDVR